MNNIAKFIAWMSVAGSVGIVNCAVESELGQLQENLRQLSYVIKPGKELDDPSNLVKERDKKKLASHHSFRIWSVDQIKISGNKVKEFIKALRKEATDYSLNPNNPEPTEDRLVTDQLVKKFFPEAIDSFEKLKQAIKDEFKKFIIDSKDDPAEEELKNLAKNIEEIVQNAKAQHAKSKLMSQAWEKAIENIIMGDGS